MCFREQYNRVGSNEPGYSAPTRSSDDDDAENDATDDPADADENLRVKDLESFEAFVKCELSLKGQTDGKEAQENPFSVRK